MADSTFTFYRTVNLADTDLAGVAHFSRLLDYVEEAEHAFFAQLGIPVVGAGSFWPRLKIGASFRRPLSFGAKARVELDLVRVGTSSLNFHFRILHDEEICCDGTWVICHCQRDAEGKMYAAPFPQAYLAALEGVKKPD